MTLKMLQIQKRNIFWGNSLTSFPNKESQSNLTMKVSHAHNKYILDHIFRPVRHRHPALSLMSVDIIPSGEHPHAGPADVSPARAVHMHAAPVLLPHHAAFGAAATSGRVTSHPLLQMRKRLTKFPDPIYFAFTTLTDASGSLP